MFIKVKLGIDTTISANTLHPLPNYVIQQKALPRIFLGHVFSFLKVVGSWAHQVPWFVTTSRYATVSHFHSAHPIKLALGCPQIFTQSSTIKVLKRCTFCFFVACYLQTQVHNSLQIASYKNNQNYLATPILSTLADSLVIVMLLKDVSVNRGLLSL